MTRLLLATGIRRLLFLLLLAGPASLTSQAQNQYVSTLNYSNLSVNRVAYAPGVMWVVGDNSTYDANHQRFFFQGNATRVIPWNLYTIDVVAGTVLSNPVCPSVNSTAGSILGLHYDNATDTLYALYLTSTAASFCWIDPASGMVNIISAIPGFTGYTESTFDTQHHRYIVTSGTQLWVIDAATGAVLANPAFSPGAQINLPLYDNLTGHLYAVGTNGPTSPFQFDTVGLSNGILYPISTLPAMSLPSGLGTVTIDEVAGKYIFLGQDPPSACINNYLYVLDINSGAILARILYPYARGTSIPTDENVIEYSFDNQRGTLYALNWHPPPITSFIQISAADSPICAGAIENFTATTTPGLTSPSFQWQWNGNNTGTNSPTYSNDSLANGDSVRCILTLDSACSTPVRDTSNSLRIPVTPVPITSVSITASAITICQGDSITFTATSANGGSAPAFQWEVNGAKEGSNSTVFSTNALNNGDSVSCLLLSSQVCAQPISSAAITPLIRPVPAVTVRAADTVIPFGAEVQLQTTVDTAVVSYQWTPANTLNDPSIADPIASPSTGTLYQVSVLGFDGCTGKASVEIKVYRALKMPNAFTPNGNGRNDIFRVPLLLQITVINFSVYDRLGARMFSTSNSTEGWDGTFNGRPQPTGTYVWQLEYIDLRTGKPATASGTVMLIR
ncbi:MAG TPA: gliding motility-associated C-terminal domain-containing protein [Puia sp.]|jgi:gliding motility-associated-like protein|nr:gliding motility-associated C-terminal domain-containing protein [Puia sp.]